MPLSRGDPNKDYCRGCRNKYDLSELQLVGAQVFCRFCLKDAEVVLRGKAGQKAGKKVVLLVQGREVTVSLNPGNFDPITDELERRRKR